MKFSTRTPKNPDTYIEAEFTLVHITPKTRSSDQERAIRLPYFSLTGHVVWNKTLQVSGAIHPEILQAFPDLADAAALHLSDITGRPLHALENAKYFAGFPNRAGSRSQPNPQALADLWRIPLSEAQTLLYEALLTKTTPFVSAQDLLQTAHLRNIPRWNEEAKAALRKYKLAPVQV